jgi:hypothetical protein
LPCVSATAHGKKIQFVVRPLSNARQRPSQPHSHAAHPWPHLPATRTRTPAPPTPPSRPTCTRPASPGAPHHQPAPRPYPHARALGPAPPSLSRSLSNPPPRSPTASLPPPARLDHGALDIRVRVHMLRELRPQPRPRPRASPPWRSAGGAWAGVVAAPRWPVEASSPGGLGRVSSSSRACLTHAPICRSLTPITVGGRRRRRPTSAYRGIPANQI